MSDALIDTTGSAVVGLNGFGANGMGSGADSPHVRQQRAEWDEGLGELDSPGASSDVPADSAAAQTLDASDPATAAAETGPRPLSSTATSAGIRAEQGRPAGQHRQPRPAASDPGSQAPPLPGAAAAMDVLVAALRAGAVAMGVPPAQVEERVAQALAFLRRRLEGDFVVDDFGLDPDFAEHVFFPMMRPIYRHWFRIEVRGVENLPREGGGLIVANHSGTVAIDSMMTQVAVHDEHPDHRYLRPLGADLVFQTPFLGAFARRSGATIAANPDAERLLQNGELVGVWPEGFKGVGKPFKDRYKLQRFGRGGFVSAALRTGAPIIPTSIVGAEEIYPIIGDVKTLARLFGLPYFPITANMLLGPLGLLPFPSKWIIEFGRPVETDVLGPQAAEDPMLVFDITDRVREQIQQSLYRLLMQRQSVFS